MTVLPWHRLFICLLGVGCLIASTEVRAQSQHDARKRSFAELLAARRKVDAAKESAAASLKERQAAEPAHQTRAIDAVRASAHATSPLFARISPVAATSVGLNPSSGVVPSGFGAGRDGFVEDLYVQILGRNIVQPELDYWSRQLKRGVSAIAVANLIWNSQEHQTLIRAGEAPGIPFRQVYFSSLAFGKAAARP